MRPCPSCGKQIKDAVDLCKYCLQTVPAIERQPDGSIVPVKTDPSKNFYCLQCGSVARPRKYTKGSFGVEIALWLLMILPGMIYSLWRLTTKYRGCPKCGAPNMIPVSSPRAQEALSRQS